MPAYIALVGLFFLVLLGTRSTFFGDTSVYVDDIGSALQGRRSGASLLDFGHLIYRPLGATLTRLSGTGPGMSLPRQIAANLIVFNIFASAVCAIALWTLMRLLTGVRVSGAALACAAFLATNGFINLSRAGTAWMAGLACLLAASCCALEAGRRNSLKLAACAAALTAGSIVFWVPYVLSAITVACACLLAWEERNPGKRLGRASLSILPLAGLITMIAFAIAIHARHITTVAEFWEWVRLAGHGEGRDRQWLRMFFGLPRSFLILADDGVLWKQFLFRDPYAGVGLWDVLRASAWKIALFYLAAGLTTVEVLRQARARGILFWGSAAVLPTLALAVLFEAGSVERYLALYPAVFVAFAWVVSERSTALVSRVLVAFFCAVLIVNNLWANSRPRVDAQRARSLARLETVLAGSKAGADGLTIYTINIRDDLATLYDPNDRSLDSLPQLRPLIPTLAPQIAKWKGLFGENALAVWKRGGEVWVTKRALAERPRREWLWVEGDDWRVRWKDIGAVAAGFEADSDAGGADGFFRVANTPGNREKALALAAKR